MLFRDRIDAGVQLANRLSHFSFHQPIVIGLPRGGVPVAHVIAERLHFHWDVVIVRKIGAPGHEELGVGAVAEDGMTMFNQSLMKRLGLNVASLNETIEREMRELQRRIKQFRRGRPLTSVSGKDVILVDDGLATGYTAAAAAQYLHQQGARQITLAVPVCALETESFLEQHVDQILCLKPCEPLFSVGLWYQNFEQTSDEEVIALLNNNAPPENSEVRE